MDKDHKDQEARYREQTINLLTRMVQAPSVTGDTKGYQTIASILSEEMESMGFNTERVGIEAGKPNVVGTIDKGSHPVLLLNGHVDVVPPGPRENWEMDPFQGKLEGDRLFGRGACDMKGGLAAMLTGAKIFLDSRPKLRGSLILTGTVDEEIGGFDGLKYLMDQGLRADLGIVCEPTELKIANVSKGLVWIELKTQGKEAHGSMPERGVNAISKMARLLLSLEANPPCSGTHEVLGSGTFNIGAIHAGTKPNIVPGICEAQIDVRYLPGQSHEEIVRQIEDLIRESKSQDPDLLAQVGVIRYRIPVEVPENAEIIRRISRATEEVTGRRPELRGMVSPGDVEHLFRVGIPGVMFGPGSESLAHTANEWISIDSALTASLIYATLMRDILT